MFWRPKGAYLMIGLVLCSVFVANIVILTGAANRCAKLVQYADCSSIVVSLATFGVRTFNIKEVLLSLMRQTVTPDMIVVHVSLQSRTENISKHELYSFFDHNFGPCKQLLSGWIQCRNGLVVITGVDYGPATKVLGTLLLPDLDGDSCIVSVDDDMIYDPNMVKTLSVRAPVDGSLGFSCEEVSWALNLVHTFHPGIMFWRVTSGASSWQYPFDDVLECKGWLHGYQGIIYRRKFFDSDVFDMQQSMPRGCFYHDDVRLAGYLWRRGIKRYVYPHFVHGGVVGWGGSEPFYHMEKNASNALSRISNTMAKYQWPCIEYFDQFK